MAPINLPDGTEVSEVILPDGATASEVIAPDGSTVFGGIPDTAVNYWSHIEGSGDTVSDSAGSVDLSLTQGNGSWVESQNYQDGSAFDYDGSNSVAIGSGLSDFLYRSNDFTFEIWLNLGSLGAGESVFYDADPNDTSKRFAVGTDKNDNGRFGVELKSDDPDAGGTISIDWSGLTQLVFVYDSSNGFTTYVDTNQRSLGGSDGTNSLDTGVSSSETSIGARNDGSAPLNAIVDLAVLHDEKINVQESYDRHPST